MTYDLEKIRNQNHKHENSVNNSVNNKFKCLKASLEKFLPRVLDYLILSSCSIIDFIEPVRI